jgi:hypothetical protein
MALRDAAIVAGTVTDVRGQTTSLTIKQNAKAGAKWQDQVRQTLEQQYDPSKYDILENMAIRNQRGEVVKINDKYVRPDFQIINRATGRIAAIYEAKTGSLTYLSGPGQQVILRYQRYAARVGYKAPPVYKMYKTRNANLEDRPAGALDYLSGAVAVLGALDLGLQLYEQEQQREKYQQQLDWLKQNDPEYYNRLQEYQFEQSCQQPGAHCA